MFGNIFVSQYEGAKFLAATVGVFFCHFGAAQAQFAGDFFVAEGKFVQFEHLLAMLAHRLQYLIDHALPFVLKRNVFRIMMIGVVVFNGQRLGADIAPAVEPVLFGDAKEVGLQAAVALEPAFADVAVEQDEGFLEYVFARRLVAAFQTHVPNNPFPPARGAVQVGKHVLALLRVAQQRLDDLFVGTTGRIFQSSVR